MDTETAAGEEPVDLTDSTNGAAADSDYHELTETLVATMTLGGGCCDIAVSRTGDHVYVADHDSVKVIGTSNHVVATVAVAGHPTALAIDPAGHLVCVTSHDGPVSIINTADNTLRTMPGHSIAAALSPDGARIYVIHPDTHSISAVDTATRSTQTIVLQDTPLGATVTPDSSHIYLTTLHSLIIVDATTSTVETIPVGDLPRRVQMSPDGKRAYVANFGSHTVSVLDAITNSVVTVVEVGGHPEALGLSPDGGRLYVGDYWAGALAVIAIPSVTDHRAWGQR